MADFEDDLDDAHIIPRKIVPRGEVPLQKVIDEKMLQDPDPHKNTIICINCREPIFEIQIIKAGMSHRVVPLGNYQYKNQDNECPKCRGAYFYVNPDGRPRFLTTKGEM